MGDRTTQFVLGMFVGTFVYCWAVAESLPPGSGPVGDAAVLPDGGRHSGLVASFASIILLITHFSTMMQAPTIAV